MRMDHPFILSSNILPTSFSLFSLLLRFSVVELRPALFILSQIQHIIVFGKIQPSEGIVKFYYCGSIREELLSR